MSDSHPSPRLAAYGALAAGALAAGTHADVQVYEGPPIPLDTGGGTTTLSLAGVDFDLLAGEGSFSVFSSSLFIQCCSYVSSKGGSYCAFSATVGFVNQASGKSLLFSSCGSDLASIAFQAFGDPVGGGGCYAATFVCASSFFSSQTCDGGTQFTDQSCSEQAVQYAGFTFMASGSVYQGWARIEGTPGDYEITRWAFEDDGGDITIGQEPAPKCDADINGDGKVDASDLGLLLGAWGDCQ